MRKTLLFFTILLSCLSFFSQNLDFKWSEQFRFDNKLDGFFDMFVGTNEQFIYAKFSNLSLRQKKANKKIKLIAFDKKTMKKLTEVPLKGYDKDSEKLDYVSTFVFKKMIYLVWKIESKKKKEYFLQSFDDKLKKLNKLTKVYELFSENGKFDDFVIRANESSSKILFLKELPITKDDENLRIEYKLLNSDLNFNSARQVTLPVKFTKKRRGLFSSNKGVKMNYTLGDDQNLYINDLIKMDEEDRKDLKKRESFVYTYFAQVNLNSGTVKDYKVKYDAKNTFQVSFLMDKGKLKLYGFFSDLNKDTRGTDTHGIFYVGINGTNFKVETTHFEYFEKNFLDQLYARDKEDQKEGKGLLKGKKAKESDNTSINDSYEIEQSVSEGNYLTLFCSMKYNYQTTTCNSQGACRTNYYCRKKNVTVFRLNQEGKFVWAKNVDREIVYNGTDIYDLKVIQINQNYYALYGTSRDLKGKRARLSSFNDKFEYAVFSGSDGSYKRAECIVNQKGIRRKDKKLVFLNGISILDNRMYIVSAKARPKTGLYFTMLVPPVYYFLRFNMNMYKGKGFIGNISL